MVWGSNTDSTLKWRNKRKKNPLVFQGNYKSIIIKTFLKTFHCFTNKEQEQSLIFKLLIINSSEMFPILLFLLLFSFTMNVTLNVRFYLNQKKKKSCVSG